MSELEPDPLEDVQDATSSRDQQLFRHLSQEEQTENNRIITERFIKNSEFLDMVSKFNARIRASRCWGSNYEDLWNNGKHMGILYDNLTLVKKTLLASTKILCDNLKPNDTLLSMKSKGALTQDDSIEIKKQTTATEQVDKLIEVLMRKPVSAYNTFMDILQEERPDLHRQIKTIEKRQSLKRKHDVEEEKIVCSQIFGSPFTSTRTLSDKDIGIIVNGLNPNQLKRLYKQLNITHADKKEAIKENLDPKEEARFILHYWRENNGLEATRQKILDALIACGLKYKALVFEKQWGACYARAGIKDHPPEVTDES